MHCRSKVEQPQDMITGNPTVVRLVVRFYRNGRGLSALREILGKVIQDMLEDKLLNIHTDPVHLYKSWINQTEAQTGQRRWAAAMATGVGVVFSKGFATRPHWASRCSWEMMLVSTMVGENLTAGEGSWPLRMLVWT